MNSNDTYTSPLATRNASPEMLRLWSPRHKFNTWRRIWLAVAEAQHEVTKDWGSCDSVGAPRASEGSSRSSNLSHHPACAGGSGWGPLVTREQVEELRAVVERGITDEEIARAAELERDLRHDVMSHVHCLGEQCPKARAIIHLGCTSQDVVCNADLSAMRESLSLVEAKLARAVVALARRADMYKVLPTLGFTHYQPAQPVTVGRRLALWSHDLSIVLRWGRFASFGLRGLRGATGTQASFLGLVGEEWVDDLEAASLLPLLPDDVRKNWNYRDADAVATWHQYLVQSLESSIERNKQYWTQEQLAKQQSWFENVRSWDVDDRRRFYMYNIRGYTFALVGQTYPRVIDTFILADLASVASVLHKIATDIRLLSNRKELDEPFGKNQIGSSAMPYKRNPMKCERICGLARFVMNLVGNAYDTAATQWLERTLDDSSNRRLSLPEAFLALDGALDLMHEVAGGLVVHEAMVRKNLMAELPFLATENILMEAVKAGADRQEYHEIIRRHAQAAGMRVKQEGLDNDLLDRLQNDKAFWSKSRGGPLAHELDWSDLMDPMKYVGRSVEQTERFIEQVVEPLRERYADQLEQLGSSDRGV